MDEKSAGNQAKQIFDTLDLSSKQSVTAICACTLIGAALGGRVGAGIGGGIASLLVFASTIRSRSVLPITAARNARTTSRPS